MPQQTKIFRVFVSSTFTDMKEERRILQRDVFPKLEKYCEERGAKFQAVDLRWGVNEESQLDQKTIDICLNEIARCQKLSPKPNFLVLLGNRYGWQPVPAKIPETEMIQVSDQLAGDDLALINKWYKLDTNAIPPEFVLQPRGKEFEEYEIWEKVEIEIRRILRNAVDKLSFTDDQRIKYFASATHQEILKGALNPPEGTEKPEEHVFAFVRKINGLPINESAKCYVDFDEELANSQNPDIEPLQKLKTELSNKLGNHIIGYDADWKYNRSQIIDPGQFAADNYKFLHDIIEEQIEEVISEDENEKEAKIHTEFKDLLIEHFRGRNNILNKINGYISDPDEKRIMSMIGDSGSGKSSVMAKAIENTKGDVKNTMMVFRFIGVSSGSTNIISLLRGLCGEIAGNFNESLESIAGKDQEKSLYEIQGLSEIFRKCLGLATPEKPIMLFLDALNQLSDTDNAKALYWLPNELPENVKIVVSSLPELKENLNDTLQEILPLLPEKEAREILKRWFEAINRTLTEEQFNEVIISFNLTKLAIYLKVAFEMARHWYSYDKDYIIKDDVKGLINEYFDFLENEEHDKEFVQTALSYMLCGKYMGLTENEILEILVFDKDFWNTVFLDEENGICHKDHRQELIDLKASLDSKDQEPKVMMKIPIVLWSRLFLDLEPFLTEKDADGVPIITFFHQQFFGVLKERYGLVEEYVEK